MKKEYTCHIQEDVKLYKIGMFAQMNHITVKALRYYDEIDLLKPEFVDEENGYRYYTSAQLLTLHKIIALKHMNFSIEEIKQVLQGISESKLLHQKKHHLMLELSQITKKIASIDSYLNGSYFENNYSIVMKSLPEVHVACMHTCLSSYEEMFYKMPEMGYLMEQAGCVCAQPEYCFTMYLDQSYKENDIDALLCEAVVEKKADSEALKFETLPFVPMAMCVLHKGSYESLPQAYAAIVSYIEENDYEIIGLQREYYIDGVWNQEDESQWLTEIQFPVRKR